ncbi:hypothetical protein SVIOM342S_06525 [Streptomyces violaceorubidus]
MTREFASFAVGRARVLGLVGAPGSGRTTELAALAARRSGGPDVVLMLWLRGADLHDDDMSLADAARRTLAGPPASSPPRTARPPTSATSPRNGSPAWSAPPDGPS